MLMVDGIEAQVHRVFQNLRAVATAAGGSMTTCEAQYFLTDLGHFTKVNEIMATYFPSALPGACRSRPWHHCHAVHCGSRWG